MIINVLESELIVGQCDNQMQLINLPYTEGLDFNLQLPNGTQLVSGMRSDLSAKCKLTRIIELLSKLPMTDASAWAPYQHNPVFWLLPNLAPEMLTQWVNALHQAFPHCFEHPNGRIFPMGSASLPIAFEAAKTMGSRVDSIVFIAVDSLYFDMPELYRTGQLINADIDEGIRPSEAAIMTKVQVSTEEKTSLGLHVTDVFQDAATQVQLTQSIKRLFTQLTEQDESSLLKQLYFPGDNQTIQDSWLNAYEQLAGKIDQDTQITQTNYYTGNIGAAAGLYNLLHVFNRYKEQGLSGVSVQLEVSEERYLGLLRYEWLGCSGEANG
ncbi:hypothetical protein [Shewanella japonica]|uniref:hypothetical protein n=1 Tax=Shewanella japonica TaxID=93973 RepID=UPI000E772250|nr:hypothetical protein [Shewanella japonica]